MNKKMLIALGVSLALNFIFIGFEASNIYHRPAFTHIPPVRPGFAFKQEPGEFGSPEQKMIRASFYEVFKNHSNEMKEARQTIKDALKKEPFDVEEFKAALQKASDIRSTIDAAVQENMINMISKMSPEERQHFAEKFGKPEKMFKEKRKERGGFPDPDRIRPFHKHKNHPRHHKLECRKFPHPPMEEFENERPLPRMHSRHFGCGCSCGCAKRVKPEKELPMKELPQTDSQVKNNETPAPENGIVTDTKDTPAVNAVKEETENLKPAPKRIVKKRIRRNKLKTAEQAVPPVTAPVAAE